MSAAEISSSTARQGRCACGEVRFELRAAPLMRFYCHCSICQAFNQAAVADYTVFALRDVIVPPQPALVFGTYRPPPAIQRGKCSACGKPVLEVMDLFAMPKLVFVPTANLPDPSRAPAPCLHSFYDRRLADSEDALPKFRGYWPSQLGFVGKLMVSMLRRRDPQP